MIHIDTLAFVRRLTAAGFEREQAEAIVEGLADVDTSGLATKNDLAEPKAELKADIARLEIRLGEFKTELFRHMLVQTGVIVGAVIALMKLLP
jgi:hypothetical protein